MSTRRYQPSPSAWVTVIDEPPGPFYDAGIKPAQVQRIARLGNVPHGHGQTLRHVLRGILLTQAMIADEYDPQIGRHFTRRQLLERLSRLANLPGGVGLPYLSRAIRDELWRIEVARLREARFGPKVRQLATYEEIVEAFEASEQMCIQSEQRLQAALRDANALRELARDAHAAVSARRELTHEMFAVKRALDPYRSHVADTMLKFWVSLGRTDAVTKQLIAMTDAVYRTCGIKMNADAVKKQLQSAGRRARAR